MIPQQDMDDAREEDRAGQASGLMPSVIDLDTLREMLAELEDDAKRCTAGRYFAALPHRITVLKRVIAYHSGEIFPGEVTEGLDRSQDHARPITAVTSRQPAKYDVSWQVAMAALETIANPVFGIGFNGLRRIAKKGLRDAKSALKPAPSEVAA